MFCVYTATLLRAKVQGNSTEIGCGTVTIISDLSGAYAVAAASQSPYSLQNCTTALWWQIECTVYIVHSNDSRFCSGNVELLTHHLALTHAKGKTEHCAQFPLHGRY